MTSLKEWAVEELHGKTVQFNWNRSDQTVSGKGRFVVTKHMDQRFSVLIQPLSNGVDPRLHLVVRENCPIGRCPDPDAEFLCTI